VWSYVEASQSEKSTTSALQTKAKGLNKIAEEKKINRRNCKNTYQPKTKCSAVHSTETCTAELHTD
jgi:hypothetical protein